MVGYDILHRPQSLFVRKLLFQIHLWVGLGIGAYMFLMGVTGSVLVFREELEHWEQPTLYPPMEDETVPAPIVDVIRSIQRAYPEHRIASVYSPTRGRPVYYGFIEQRGEFRTILAAPGGHVLGERPTGGFVRGLQDLHVNLLSGRTGRIVNGIGAALLFVLCATGALIWWPGIEAWRRNIRIDFRKSWRRLSWEIHSATGFWTVLVVAMWAVTGVYFTFPQPFRDIVWRLFPPSTHAAPQSGAANGRQPIDIDALVADARARLPEGHVAGVVLPATERGTVVVQISRSQPDHMDNTGYVHFTFDRYSGELLDTWDQLDRSTGDAILSWVVPLHFGTFGGLPLKLLWVVLGLSPPLLFATAAVMWWNRVLRRRWNQLKAA